LNLSVEDVCVSFKKERQTRLFGKERQQVLKNVSFELKEGECLALAGESGSGKSTLGRVVCGLLRPEKGRVLIDGSGEAGCTRRGAGMISVVFQDYATSVNPRFRVRDIVAEPLRALRRWGESACAEARLGELLGQVGLPLEYQARYPHELSGGELQRVCIARAVAANPKLIVLDEAISSLDASTQVQVMDLLAGLRREYGFSYFFITHDLTAVTYMCDRVIFLNEGRITERVDDMAKLSQVRDGYAKKLLDSVVLIGQEEVDL
jgi:nickel transport system ATP-binding protein